MTRTPFVWEKAYRCCTLCQPGRDGTGTKMTIALRPCPTSICRNPGVSKAAQCPSAFSTRLYHITPTLCSNIAFTNASDRFLGLKWSQVILPRVQTRIEEDADRSSGLGRSSRDHRERSRWTFRSRKAIASMGCWQRSCSARRTTFS